MSSSIGRGALGAFAAFTLIYSSASLAGPAAQPPAKTAPRSAPPARPAAPAARPAPRYVPPPPPPPALNALPIFEGFVYAGPGNFHASGDGDSVSHGTTDVGIGAWGVAAQHVLLGADYDHDRLSFEGGHFNFGRLQAGVGYIGSMGRAGYWYAKASVVSFRAELISGAACNGSCGHSTQTGGGAGGGFIFPFADRWNGHIDAAYAYLGRDGDNPALNEYSIGGKLEFKVSRVVGLWAGVNARFYTDADNSGDNGHIDFVDGRFGVSFDVY